MRSLLLAIVAAFMVVGCAESEGSVAKPTETAPAKGQKSPWPAKGTPEAKFAGRYWTARGPVDAVEKFNMTLQPDKTCMLSMEYAGKNKQSLLFKGTWTATMDAATCIFDEVSGKPERSVFVFKFEPPKGRGAPELVTVQWNKKLLGDKPIRLTSPSGGALGAG